MSEVEKPFFTIKSKKPFKDDILYVTEIEKAARVFRIIWTLTFTKRLWTCGVCLNPVPIGADVYRAVTSKYGFENVRICVPCMRT